jgi:nitroreductase
MKNINRRQVLKNLGLLGAAGGSLILWRTHSQGIFSVGQGAAYTPWREKPEASLSGFVKDAILAATPHNVQAWRFRVSNDTIDVYDDLRRSIGSVDPFRREIQIGLGAAIENLMIGATAAGFASQLSYLPNPKHPAHIARIRLTKLNSQTTDLHPLIRQRHTNRSAFLTRAVPAPLLERLNSTAPSNLVRLFWLTSTTDIKSFADWTMRATEDFIEDQEMSADSDAWFRYDWQTIQQERDGVTLDAQNLEFWMAGLGKLLPKPDAQTSHNYWRNNTKTHVLTAPAFGVIAIANHLSPAARLEAGRFYQRIALLATREGLATQPLHQITEMRDRNHFLEQEPIYANALSQWTGQTWQAVMPFRIGYPSQMAKPSPRRPLEQVLMP